jgi:hypothetical protein
MDPSVLTIHTSTNGNEALYKVSRLPKQSSRRSKHRLFHTLLPSWIHHNPKKNDWIFMSRQYAHLLMIMNHCLMFQVSTLSHLVGEVSIRYSTPFTLLGSTITHLKDISCRNAHLGHQNWYRMNFTLNSLVLTMCISTNDSEALYKIPSLYDQTSRRSENRVL